MIGDRMRRPREIEELRMLGILCGEESGTKCHERRDRLLIVDIHNRYMSPLSGWERQWMSSPL